MWVRVWWSPMPFDSLISLQGIRLKIKVTWKKKRFLSFVMFVSWFCVGTVCQCLLCGGCDHRSLLSLLIAQGWHRWISTTLQITAAGQRGLIQRTERWQGVTRPNQNAATRSTHPCGLPVCAVCGKFQVKKLENTAHFECYTTRCLYLWPEF